MTGIFRAYDIRGIYPDSLNEKIAEKIGKAFGTLNPGTIVVGGDARLSTPAIKKKLIDGLVSTGVKVVDIGMVATPMVNFAVGFYGYDGGIMVTGSHTPANYNGLKFLTKGVVSLSYETGLDEIEKLTQTGEFRSGKGMIVQKDIFDDYSNFIVKHFYFTSENRLKIVLDGSHGSSGKYYAKMLRSLGFEIIELFCEPDGHFPVHGPDPTKAESLIEIGKKVVEECADLGLIFDGDGDRLVVVQGNGEELDANRLFVLLVKKILSGNQGAIVIHDALCSQMITDAVRKYGGCLKVCRVGHSYIAKLLSEGGVFAGELSGHYYFKETYNQDDVIFASLVLLEYLIENDTTIQNEILDIPDYFSDVSESNRATINEKDKFTFIEKIKNEYKEKGYEIDDLDGVKVIFDDGWALFRPSNTEPKLSYVFESTTEEGLERIRSFVTGIIERIPK